MTTTEKIRQEGVPRSCRECSHWQEAKRKLRISKFVTKALKAIESRVAEKDFKPTMGDYLKLLQIEQELGHEQPKEIKVTWIEPPAESNSEA